MDGTGGSDMEGREALKSGNAGSDLMGGGHV